jgi:adenylate cyclase class 2
MQNEFETKVPNIDVQELIDKLKNLGAKETPEFLAKRYVYDISTENIEWIRLRQIHTKTTLTYKYKVKGNTKIGETIEIEVEVSDFDKTAEILSKIPFKEVYYQENKKTHLPSKRHRILTRHLADAPPISRNRIS